MTRKDEAARIIANADKMARRIGARFVVNPDWLADFIGPSSGLLGVETGLYGMNTDLRARLAEEGK